MPFGHPVEVPLDVSPDDRAGCDGHFLGRLADVGILVADGVFREPSHELFDRNAMIRSELIHERLRNSHPGNDRS